MPSLSGPSGALRATPIPWHHPAVPLTLVSAWSGATPERTSPKGVGSASCRTGAAPPRSEGRGWTDAGLSCRQAPAERRVKECMPESARLVSPGCSNNAALISQVVHHACAAARGCFSGLHTNSGVPQCPRVHHPRTSSAAAQRRGGAHNRSGWARRRCHRARGAAASVLPLQHC